MGQSFNFIMAKDPLKLAQIDKGLLMNFVAHTYNTHDGQKKLLMLI